MDSQNDPIIPSIRHLFHDYTIFSLLIYFLLFYFTSTAFPYGVEFVQQYSEWNSYCII